MVQTWSCLPREVGRGSEEPGGKGDRAAAFLGAAPALGGDVKKFRPCSNGRWDFCRHR